MEQHVLWQNKIISHIPKQNGALPFCLFQRPSIFLNTLLISSAPFSLLRFPLLKGFYISKTIPSCKTKTQNSAGKITPFASQLKVRMKHSKCIISFSVSCRYIFTANLGLFFSFSLQIYLS